MVTKIGIYACYLTFCDNKINTLWLISWIWYEVFKEEQTWLFYLSSWAPSFSGGVITKELIETSPHHKVALSWPIIKRGVTIYSFHSVVSYPFESKVVITHYQNFTKQLLKSVHKTWWYLQCFDNTLQIFIDNLKLCYTETQACQYTHDMTHRHNKF